MLASLTVYANQFINIHYLVSLMFVMLMRMEKDVAITLQENNFISSFYRSCEKEDWRFWADSASPHIDLQSSETDGEPRKYFATDWRVIKKVIGMQSIMGTRRHFPPSWLSSTTLIWIIIIFQPHDFSHRQPQKRPLRKTSLREKLGGRGN